ncbi:MAG: cytidylate kinase family protein [Thermodesulfobacteriota bacterium]
MNIVSISRQVGSFGDEIGAKVAERAGLTYTGREKVHELAVGCDPEYSDACSLYEAEHGPGFFARLFFDRPTYTSLFYALTYELASQGDVVIAGRGSQIVLRDVPGVLRVRVVAPTEMRVRRIMERHNCPEDEAWDYVHKLDSENRNQVRSIFDVDPRDWGLYDLVINTEKLTAAGGVDIVCQALKSIDKVADPEAVKQDLTNRAVGKRIETLVRKRLSSAVARYVEITVEAGGVVRITGRVAEKKEKQQVGEIVSEHPCVTKVENELKVTQLTFGAV